MLFFWFILTQLVCNKCQTTCIKWLESINNSYPYLSAHNTYHLRQTRIFAADEKYASNVTIPRYSYSWPSLTELLSNGVVGIELDIAPSNELSGNNDLPVYHFSVYDITSSCVTFRKCLTEINEWYKSNNGMTSAPIFISVQLKTDDGIHWTKNELSLINTIWTDIFDEGILYTPSYHQNGNLLQSYNDWSNVCVEDVENKIIPSISKTYVDLNQDILSSINMFPRCNCQTDAYYCIVLKDNCENEILGINSTNKLKYLYRTWIEATQMYPQWNEYPIRYNQSVPYGQHMLGFQVKDELINEIHSRFPQYEQQIMNPLTADEWEYWQIVSYLDAMNNNNGLWEKNDLLKFLKTIAPTTSMLDLTVTILFWKEGFSEWNVLNPLLWAKVRCLWNADYGLDIMVIHANLSKTLIEICKGFEKGYQYLYTDYPYNWTYFQDFTVRDIERNNICDNITITKKIKQSMITSDCATASDLKSIIIIGIIGIIIGIIILVIIISVIIYCFVCRRYKNGGCKPWCQDKCCKCCCSFCHCDCCGRTEYDRANVDDLNDYDVDSNL